ncbi:copper resistance CopC family protein [Kocuria palustris]|uniref:copper resistance CopC family protein n=1 Tax=Kocuria palustris TaxID=71999 RepID=UPI001642B573|nr:copper resistance CopC family protein [Kocuria palustris]
MSNSRNHSTDARPVITRRGTARAGLPTAGRARRRAGRAAAGLAAAAIIAAPAPALAHDTMTGSVPEDGASEAQAPQEIELSFTAQPQDVGAQIQVTGPDGADVTADEPQIEGTSVIQELSDDADAPGEYSVAWRVVSSDGHPIEGAFDYTVDGEAGASEQPSDGASAAEPGAGESASEGSSQEASEAQGSQQAPAEAGESDTVEDQGSGTALWLMIGGGIVVLGAVAAAIVMMRRMSR